MARCDGCGQRFNTRGFLGGTLLCPDCLDGRYDDDEADSTEV